MEVSGSIEFAAGSVFVKNGKTLGVLRTTISGDGGRIIAGVTSNRVAAG